MALGFGDVPLEVVIRASNQLAPGLAAAGAQLKAFQAEVGRSSGQLSFPGMGGAGGMGLLGAVGPTLGIAGGVALIGGAVAASKSLVDTYRAEQTALADVTQAYESVGSSAGYYLDQIQKYIDTHASYISDQNAVREGFAYLTRAGIDQTLVQKGVNDALDLSILKHQDFATSLNVILLGLEGNARGLKSLGINTKDYGDLTKSATQIAKDDAEAKKKVDEAGVNLSKANRTLAEDLQRLHDKGYTTANDLMHEQDLKGKVKDATAKLHEAQGNYNTVVAAGNAQLKNQNELLDTIDAKTKDAPKTLDALQKAQNDVNHQWERLSNQIGPPLLTVLGHSEEHLANIVGDVVDRNLGKGVKDFSDAMSNIDIGPLSTAAKLWGFIAQKVGEVNKGGGLSGPTTGGGHAGVGGPHSTPPPSPNLAPSSVGSGPGGVGI